MNTSDTTEASKENETKTSAYYDIHTHIFTLDHAPVKSWIDRFIRGFLREKDIWKQTPIGAILLITILIFTISMVITSSCNFFSIEPFILFKDSRISITFFKDDCFSGKTIISLLLSTVVTIFSLLLLNKVLSPKRKNKEKSSFKKILKVLRNPIPDLLADMYYEKEAFLDTMDTTLDGQFQKVVKFANEIRFRLINRNDIQFSNDTHIVFVHLPMNYGKNQTANPYDLFWNRFRDSLKRNIGKLEVGKTMVLPFYGVHLNDIMNDNSFSAIGFINKHIISNRMDLSPAWAEIIDNIKFVDKPISVGFKVYPPCDPNFKKVLNNENLQAFFEMCAEKRIPITTHCSDGGFELNQSSNANPIHWKNLLIKNTELKVNFAHMGGGGCFSKYVEKQKVNGWLKTILALQGVNSNVYSDISYVCAETPNEVKDYLLKEKEKDPKGHKNVLWGTDWPMALMEKEEYIDIFDDFWTSDIMSNFHDFTQINAERFLWTPKSGTI